MIENGMGGAWSPGCIGAAPYAVSCGRIEGGESVDEQV